MIRPLTIATCLLACGSGLYLYQSKHEVQVLDRTIERTVHDTAALRDQSRLLAAEWTMLNDPDRLRQFSDTYLSLHTIAPSQFISLADLDSRLPAPAVDVPPPDEQVPVAAAVVPAGGPDPAPDDAPNAVAVAVADDDLPVPPIPAAPPVKVLTPPAVAATPSPVPVALAARPVVSRPPYRVAVSHPMGGDPQARQVAVVDIRPIDQRSFEQRPVDQRPPEQRAFDQRPADLRVGQAVADARATGLPPPRPIVLGAARPIVPASPRPPLPANGPVGGPPAIRPLGQSVVAASAPYSGSLLGMARSSMPPAPRPTPVVATYNAN